MNTIQIAPPELRKVTEKGLEEKTIVECVVDGETLWFRSDKELTASNEAMISAFLLQSLGQRRPIVPPGPIDETFAENIPEISRIAKEYWGFDGELPKAETYGGSPQTDRAGMFFTGGVDSFYTLKRNLAEVSCLINVHGFDIKLTDTARFEASLSGLKTVAEALDLELIVVETNLREHTTFGSLNWEVTHVAALASVAHGLQKHLSAVRVASSDVPPPWGSNPALDKLWSSAALRVINDEYGVSRFDKVREIVDWPPVHKFLKVCWQNLSADLNCGYCEKCLRTQVALLAAGGDLKDFKTFPDKDIVEGLDNLKFAAVSLHGQWRKIMRELNDPLLRSAIQRLLFRSRIKAVIQRLRRAKMKNIVRRVRRLIFGP